MNTALIKFEPDLLVGRNGNGWRDTDIDEGAREEHLDKGHISRRLDGVGLGGNASRHRAFVELDHRVTCAEHDFPCCRLFSFSRIFWREFETPALRAGEHSAAVCS